MATFDEIAGLAPDCTGLNVPKTGRNFGCTIDKGNIKHLFLLVAGTRYAAGTTFDDAFFTAEEQKGKIVSLANTKTIEWQGSDDTFLTDSAGVETLDVPGLPKMLITFKEDSKFYREMSKLRSFGAYELLIVDDKNTIEWTSYGAAGWGGLKIGHVTPGMEIPKVPGADNTKSITIQMIDRTQYDEDREDFIYAEHLIKFSNHSGVSPLLITFPTNVSAGTAAQIKVTLGDGKTAASGLDENDLLADVADVNNVIVSATEVGATGVYDLVLTTALVAAEVLGIITNDATESTKTINLAGVLYSGDKATTTVV